MTLFTSLTSADCQQNFEWIHTSELKRLLMGRTAISYQLTFSKIGQQFQLVDILITLPM